MKMNAVPKEIYLNNAASGWPKAPGVVETVARVLEEFPGQQGRSAAEADSIAEECRNRLARLLIVEDPNRIAITSNATHALNLAILGLDLKPGDRVVTTVTEHNSVLRPLNRLRKLMNIKIEAVSLDSQGSLDITTFRKALEKNPKLVVINHVSNVTGRINPIAEFFAAAKEAGAITLLDASQSLGHIEVHPDALRADLVAFTGHKGLHGPPGTGGLYVRPGIELDQHFVGGTGVRSDLQLHPANMPLRLEAGTPNIPAIAGLNSALIWLEGNFRKHSKQCSAAAEILRKGLREIPAVQIFDDDSSSDHIGVISFKIYSLDVDECGYMLHTSFGIICRTGLHCAPLIHNSIGSAPSGTVRFSVSGFTTEKEVNLSLSAVRALAKQ